MSQHSSFPSGNFYAPFMENGQSQHAHNIPSPSGVDGHAMQTDLDTLTLPSFGNTPSVASGYLGELGISNLSSVRNAATQPNDRSRFAGLENDRLLQFYRDPDGPWNPQKRGGRGNPDALPLSFAGYRETNAPSTIGPCTDSGYGSLERHSVGLPSDFGDVDRSPEALLHQLAGFQLPSGQSHGGLQMNDVNHLVQPWDTGAIGRPDGIATDDPHKFACDHCEMTFRTQSDHKKHINRHLRPHKCSEPGCPWTKGFPNTNELERHMQTKHRKGGTRYHCHHDACLKKKPPKEWPRADNFRTHLKKMHNITITAEDSLAAYKRAPTPVSETPSTSRTGPSSRPNLEILSNVGAAPELIPPADLAGVSSGQPPWGQLDQEPQPRMFRTWDTNHQLNLDTSDPSLQSSGCSHTSARAGPRTIEVSNRSRLGNYRMALPPPQDLDKDYSSRDRHSHHNYHRHTGYQDSRGHTCPTDTATESPGYARPKDLDASASPGYASPASAAEDPDREVIVVDDGEDGGSDDNPEEEHCPQLEATKSPGTPPPKFSQDGEDHNHSVTDDRVSGSEARCRTPDGSDAGPVSDGLFKPSTPLAVGKASASPSDDMEDIDSKFTREELVPHLRKQANDGLLGEPLLQLVKENVLDGKILKLAKTGLLGEPLRRQLNDSLVKLGQAPSKAPQVKGSKAATADSPLKHRCPEAYCGKAFKRPCELKKHLKRHQKPYGCTRCTLTFGSKDDWKRHENGQHLQHEVWKCDERLPRTGACGRICNRRETFRHHLATHHSIMDKERLDHKLDKCRVSQQGEPQIWCGFCQAIVTLDVGSGRDALNARYDHISDHYEGGKGVAKKRPGEWLEDDAETAEGELRDSSALRGRDGVSTQSQPKKRSRQGTIIADSTRGKRARPLPPRDQMMWTCCQCHSTWSFANTASCMSCILGHERCNDCTFEEVEPTEHHLPQVVGFSPTAFEKDVGLHR